MKNLFFAFAFIFLCNLSYAQEGIKVNGNKVSMKEIAPVWPGCENNELSRKDCFNKQMNLHIKEEFKYPKDAKGNLVRGATTLSFAIDETGAVSNISAEGPQKLINEEVIRIVKLFPKMKPGLRGGKEIAVKYKMAFNF